MKTLLRAATISIASAALVAGSATMATAAPGDTATVTIQPTVLSGFPSSTSDLVPVAVTSNRSIFLHATVNVNGVPVANNVSIFSNFFTYQRAWGAGSVTLTNFTDSSGGAAVAGTSNAAQIRYGLDYRTNIQVKKRGKKLTFNVKARYINNANRPVRVSKATVQVKKGSRWKNLKHVKLKSNGTGSFKKSDRKKRNYRLVIKETATYQGATLKLDRKI
jgi:hypothetical protein